MKYNKLWYGIAAFMLLLLTACNPIQSNDGSLGALIPASQFKLDVHATTTGGNQIVMINNTPDVAGMWVSGIGTSTSQTDTILLPFLGKNTIYFYGTTAGGIVKDSVSITISTIDHALSPTWTYLAGTGSKTWVWATDIPANWVPGGNAAGMCYGNGGYLASNAAAWWTNGLSALQGWGVATDQMTFDLNGGANFTLITGNNQILSGTTPKGLPAGTYKGTFKFDMSQTLTTSNPPSATNDNNWSIGTLTLSGATVSLGYQPNYNATPIYTYDILYLDNNVMILGAPEPGAGAWGVAWFWIFKRQGYTFS
ncbi:hypothetical protein [Microbacter margulisiae]|uniref:Uncharacterized protein n=1 Tax=Microbacter margulisiae TaxID=1350067 RepID=A0A7W5DS12_9PORP|nr:hypothetical protein [Microbacter margulisiae]MBB3187725.1 hypothetical protein [Microbacter margulisiae]